MLTVNHAVFTLQCKKLYDTSLRYFYYILFFYLIVSWSAAGVSVFVIYIYICAVKQIILFHRYSEQLHITLSKDQSNTVIEKLFSVCRTPSPLLDNIRVMVIVWNILSELLCAGLCDTMFTVIQQHTSSSCRSNRLGLSH